MVTGLQWERSLMTATHTTGHRDLVNCLRYSSRKVCLVQRCQIPCNLASLLGSAPSCSVHLHLTFEKLGERLGMSLRAVKSPATQDVTVIL